MIHGDLTGVGTIFLPPSHHILIFLWKCNILIDGAGHARLGDFGLSTIISDLQGSSTFTSSIGVNVRFAAPELYQFTEEYSTIPPTTYSDVYSLGGVILLVSSSYLLAPASHYVYRR